MSVVKFSEVAHRANTKEDRFNTDKIYYVGGEHIEPGELFIHDKGFIKGSTIGPMFYCGFKSGQILFVTRNPHLRKCSVAEFDGICSEKTFVIETIDERILLQEYLASVMLSDDFWNYCEENKSGGVNYFLNWSTLADYEFELPSVEEQKAISDKVWAAYRLKESYKKLLAATEEMVKSQFIEMFKSEDNYEPLENVVVVKDDCRKPINDGVRGSMKEGELYPYYGATGVVDYINDYITDEELLCIAEDCGNYKAGEDSSYIINGKAWVNNHAHLVKAKECCEIKYLHQYLKITDLMPYVSGTTRLKLTQKKMKEIPVLLPSIELQNKFVSIAEQADKSGFDGRKSQFIEMFGGGNWPQKTLGEVGSFTRGGGFQKSDFVEHGIPCIHYGQIHTKFGPFITSHITEISSDLEPKTKFASKGDLVIAITSEDTEGSCKSTAWLGDYPVAVGGHAAIYKHSMNPLYMSFFFKSTLFNYAKIEYVHGTKVFEIKPDDIAKILVPCPPMSLQNQFSAIAEQSDKSGFRTQQIH